MSPTNNKKLKKLRIKLDLVDNSMLNLLSNRTKIVKEILKLKKYKNQIVDKKRIKVILTKIKKKSKAKNIDSKISLRIWKNMIWGFIDYERRNFKKK